MPDSLDHCLEESIVMLQKGATVQECCARYPREAETLEPLLNTALIAGVFRFTPAMPAEARTRVRRRVMAEWVRVQKLNERRRMPMSQLSTKVDWVGWRPEPAWPIPELPPGWELAEVM